MRQLGRIEKAFLVFAAVYALLYFTRVAPPYNCWRAGNLHSRVAGAFQAGAARHAQGHLAAAQPADRGLPVIAVVPILLIVALVAIAGYAVIGQMASTW